MALTTDQLQLQLAYRLGETGAPGDSTTEAQRLEWLNQAYMTIARRRNWSWLEATNTSNTNTGSTTGYAEPTDLKEFIELKVGDVYYNEIPYKSNRLVTNGGQVVALPYLRSDQEYYRYGGRYYFTTTDDAGGDTHTIKYYKRVSKVADGGTFLIPDEFLEALTAYAEGRYWMSIFQQVKSQLPFQEFEEIVRELVAEDNRRGSGHKATSQIREPEDAYY